MSDHPIIKQFISNLQSGALIPMKKSDFDRWRMKQPEGSDLRAAADAAWAEYEQRAGTIGTGILREDARNRTPARSGASSGHSRGLPQPTAATNSGAAPASILGQPFHNPFTFLPFVEKSKAPVRGAPTLRSIDESPAGGDRRTGVLEVEVQTCSPLLTCAPGPRASTSDKSKHGVFKALSIGSDVIVPGTGIKGALRTLATILTGGTLGYVDDETWLVQGRDNNLGPVGKSSPPGTPDNAFLGRVVRPGSSQRSGTIQLGETRLIPAPVGPDVERDRPNTKRQPRVFCNFDGTNFSDKALPRDNNWELKLSGRPIDKRKPKREGIFRPDADEPIEIPKELWAAYQGRNRHANFSQLEPNDLVWLEPKDPHATTIRSAEDVKSIQWARWGREGDALVDVLPMHVRPDSANKDGMVDVVTNLFGQVRADNKSGMSFASRLRFGNLIFRDAINELESRVTLAPLSQPNPGCAAFYRIASADDTGNRPGIQLRGYKVYRTTNERGDRAPWLFANQGVYDEGGSLKDPQQKVNKTVDLLTQGCTGKIRIACHALSNAEFGILLTLASVDWRVGGGKPLGLGHCKPIRLTWVGEDGKRTEIKPLEVKSLATNDFAAATLQVCPSLQSQTNAWIATQFPVEHLRYPRAVVRNHNRLTRGGHAWFQKHASPKKATPGERRARGLETRHVSDAFGKDLKSDRIAAQILPVFDPKNPFADVLYGYDLLWEDGKKGRDKPTMFDKPKPFGPASVRGTERSGGNTSQNRETRFQDRKDRNK